MEDDAVGVVQPERLRQVPRDRLAFTIGVGREQRGLRLPGSRPELADLLLLALDHLVLGREAGIDVDADLRLGQVANMAHRGEDRVLGAEEPGERPRLAGRLDDDQAVGHLFLR